MTFIVNDLSSPTDVTGVLSVANGGTGMQSAAMNALIVGSTDASTLATSTVTINPLTKSIELPENAEIVINEASVLSATALGTTVTESSLTKFGTLSAPLNMGDQIIDNLSVPLDGDIVDENSKAGINKAYLHSKFNSFPFKTTVAYAISVPFLNTIFGGTTSALRVEEQFTLTHVEDADLVFTNINNTSLTITQQQLIGARILLTAEATSSWNGIYTFKANGTTSTELVRANDDSAVTGTMVAVTSGLQQGSVYVQIDGTARSYQRLQPKLNLGTNLLAVGDPVTGEVSSTEDLAFYNSALHVTGSVIVSAGNMFKVGVTDVLSDTTLGSTVTNSSLKRLGVQDADLHMGDETTKYNIKHLATPVDPHDAATKDYVDAFANGLHFKDAVLAVSTSDVGIDSASGTNLNLLSNLTMVDGVGVSSGSRILLVGQNDASQNGVYDVVDSLTLTRSADLDTSAEMNTGTSVYVLEGDTNAGRVYTLTSTNVTLGTTNLVFAISNSIPVNLTRTGTVTTGVWNSTLLSSNYKSAAVVAIDTNVNLGDNWDDATVDGVILAAGDRILLTQQAIPTENGLWVVQAMGELDTLLRPIDYDANTHGLNSGLAVYVERGNLLGGSIFFCTTSSIIVGTTATTWVQFSPSPVTKGITSLSNGHLLIGADTAAITASSFYVNNEGNLVMNENRVTDIGEPIGDYDAATKLYVDQQISGLMLSEYITYSTAVSTFLSQSDASTTYLTQTDADMNFLKQTDASTTYLTQMQASADYLKPSTADTIYLTQSAAENDYLSKAEAATDYATKVEVEAAKAGLTIKPPVRAMVTTELDSAELATGLNGSQTPGQIRLAAVGGSFPVVDGITLAINDRVLINSSTSGRKHYNGIFSLNGVTEEDGVPTHFRFSRVGDMNAAEHLLAGTFTVVTEGTNYADKSFVLTSDNPLTINTSDLEFSPFSTSETITAGTGLERSGNTLSIDNSVVVTRLPRVSKTTSFTAEVDKYYVVSTLESDITVTMPSVVDYGRITVYHDKTGTAGRVIIIPQENEAVGAKLKREAGAAENQYAIIITADANVATMYGNVDLATPRWAFT